MVGPILNTDTEIKHPDEDTLNELNLPQLNEVVLKESLIEKHKELLFKIEQISDLNLINLIAKRIRSTFAFLKSKLLVVSSQDIIGSDPALTTQVDDTWDDFLQTY